MTDAATLRPCSLAEEPRPAGLLSPQEREIICRYRWAGSEAEERRLVRDYANLMGASLGFAEDALDLWIDLLGLRQKKSSVESPIYREDAAGRKVAPPPIRVWGKR
jgi:hypothetical protein